MEGKENKLTNMMDTNHSEQIMDNESSMWTICGKEC